MTCQAVSEAKNKTAWHISSGRHRRSRDVFCVAFNFRSGVKALAREVATRGITVNVVAPGMIDTDMTSGLAKPAREAMLAQIPLGRLGTPDDIARAVGFLASDEAAYITGHVLAVNGGMYM